VHKIWTSRRFAVPRGRELKENEVLVKVQASTATIGDVILRKFHPLFFLPLQLFGMKRIRIPGHEWASGIVTDVYSRMDGDV
jgi:hypothetical protein